MAFIAARLCPYTNLRLKSLLAAFTAFSALDVLLYPVRYLMAPYIVYGCEVSIALVFLIYIYNKWYNQDCDVLDDDHLFIVSKRVNGLKPLVVSMFSADPQGGFGVYANGNWYHFRKSTGVIEKTNGDVLRALSNNYTFQAVGLAEHKDIERLDSMVGQRLTPFTNCITEFRRFDRG